jgi:ABC-type transporter Mla subunit MlaD
MQMSDYDLRGYVTDKLAKEEADHLATIVEAVSQIARLTARVAELTRERDEACRGLRQLADAGVAMSDHLKAANAKLAKAVEALRPFAIELVAPLMSNDRFCSAAPLTVGDLRRARATLTDLEASHDKG